MGRLPRCAATVAMKGEKTMEEKNKVLGCVRPCGARDASRVYDEIKADYPDVAVKVSETTDGSFLFRSPAGRKEMMRVGADVCSGYCGFRGSPSRMYVYAEVSRA